MTVSWVSWVPSFPRDPYIIYLYFGGKSHVSTGCKMYLLRSPVPAPGLKGSIFFRSAARGVAAGCAVGLPMVEDHTAAANLEQNMACKGSCGGSKAKSVSPQ